ncbi:MAG: D-beta-D-heptose 7-phosphate kinase / D-beta-D-heptose 1-phosphate adenosyltransferase [Parcubacteria group bacterium Athens0416_74]|nr:MAG: D-beta-D-heptose 7-phosphate kinase / D-beta-D-heptose 1-phosphate adenosyltransferase [Parcubacteria group bacterium Athens0416_74]
MTRNTYKEKSILVIGDSARDIFVYCSAARLAPDIPIPVIQVVSQSENPGMAKNVERNIKALHKRCDIITNKNWRDVTKVRYMHDKSNHGFIRVDADVSVDRIDAKKLPLKKYDIIAVSDYNKGFLAEEDIAYICAHHPHVFVDTKKPVGSWLSKAAYIKINNYEYERSLPIAKSVVRKIIRTHGEHGAEFRGKRYAVDKVEVKDASGAGDSFFAALVVEYAKSGSIERSIDFANKCASRVVQRKGVTTIQKEDTQ